MQVCLFSPFIITQLCYQVIFRNIVSELINVGCNMPILHVKNKLLFENTCNSKFFMGAIS